MNRVKKAFLISASFALAATVAYAADTSVVCQGASCAVKVNTRDASNVSVTGLQVSGATLPVVTVGKAVTGNLNGSVNIINGGLSAGNVTSTDESGFFAFTSNARLPAGPSGQNRTNTTTGGTGILLSNRASNASEAIVFYANQIGDGTGTSADPVGFITHAGDWNIGPSSSRITVAATPGNNGNYAQFSGMHIRTDKTSTGQNGSTLLLKDGTGELTVIDWDSQGGAGGSLADDDDVVIWGTCALTANQNTSARAAVYRIFTALHLEVSGATCTFTQSGFAVTSTDAQGSVFTAPTLVLSPITTTPVASCRATWGVNNSNATTAMSCELYKLSRRGRVYWY